MHTNGYSIPPLGYYCGILGRGKLNCAKIKLTPESCEVSVLGSIIDLTNVLSQNTTFKLISMGRIY